LPEKIATPSRFAQTHFTKQDINTGMVTSSNTALDSTHALLGVEPSPQFVMRLFCFPYAGAGASIYRTWPALLPKAVNVCPVQLPGREDRINEDPFTEMTALIPALAQSIFSSLDRPFAFFGHSMGALISFELARYLRREHGLQPSHLFISGHGAPKLRVPRTSNRLYPDELLQAHAERLKNNYGYAFEDVELRNLLLPVLSADLAVCSSYSYIADAPLDCPISVFSGVRERGLNEWSLGGWREMTTAAVSMRSFPGDHFFLNTARTELLETVSTQLSRIISTQRQKHSAVIFNTQS
jgi:medium-chain acyl-[acyl-carrier-protein] hydrolase